MKVKSFTYIGLGYFTFAYFIINAAHPYVEIVLTWTECIGNQSFIHVHNKMLPTVAATSDCFQY